MGAGVCAIGIVEDAAETMAITKPLFAFANVWFFVLLVRRIESIGKGLRTAPRDAIVAES